MKLYLNFDKNNQQFADDLQVKLEAWGHDVFTAADKETTQSSDADNLLESCDIVIGLLSKSALVNMGVYSDWNWSIVYQHDFDTRLLLLRVDDCIIPEHYAHLPRIDVHTLGQESAIQTLKDMLENHGTKVRKYEKPSDTYESYLKRIYNDIVQELNFLIIPVGDNPEPIHMPRSYRGEAHKELTSFEAGFALHKQRAFLLGNPGVGKTITLLMKARDAILERLQNSDAPLPIPGYVVSWKALENQPLQVWLAKHTRIKAKQLKELFDTGKCLFLFDGIDDLGSARVSGANAFDPRLRFLEHVQNLPPQHSILMTCRTEAFKDIKTRSPLSGTIELEALSDEQIETYLTETANWKRAWEQVQGLDEVKALLRLPLMLGVFGYAYDDSVDAVQNLAELKGGALRDAIFDRYVVRRFKTSQHRYHQEQEQPPFTLEEIYTMLGNVAKHGAIKYGTGEVAFVTPEDEGYGYWIAIEDMSFGFIGDDNHLADEFVDFANELHLIHVRPSGTCTFTHRLMRNYFVCKYCIPITEKIDTYAIEALSKIPDERVPDILLQIINSHFDEGVYRSAQTAYEAVTGRRLVSNGN